MTNREIARTLDRIADILQFKDENPFKIKAYRQAAHSIYHLDEDIHYLHDKGRLDEIPGVGKAIKAKLEELVEKGSLAYYDRLLQEVPAGLLEMLSIPGIGFKTIQLINQKLGVQNLQELLQAAEERKIRDLPGMGGKTEYAIIKGIEMLEKASDKNTLGYVLPLAEGLLAYLRECDSVIIASLAGSVRRGKPLVGDIDIVVASNDESEVRRKVSIYREVSRIIDSQCGHISGFLATIIPFEVIIVAPASYSSGLFWATGSKEHLARLIPDGNRQVTDGYISEQEIYRKFNLDYVQPELREDRGEIEAALEHRLPELIEQSDLKGDLHVHSNWSDGAHSIPEMVNAARELNYSYLAVTDHSRSLPISGGLNIERLLAQGNEIDKLNKELRDFTVLKGTEVDVLKDGNLDYGDEILRDLDMVIASIHTNFKLDRDKQTDRIIKAIKNENVHIIGHLSGRLLNRRPPYELDFEQVLQEAAKNQIILEINSHPDRLDIDAELAKRAKEYGIKIAVNSDAHHKNDLKLVKYGILNARRGWLEKDDVVNCLSRRDISKRFKV